MRRTLGNTETPTEGRFGGPGRNAFSLIEITIALGVISIAVCGIFGLLPVGYKIALESRTETCASFIAEQIMGDLRATPFGAASFLLYSAGGKPTASAPFNLGVAGTHVLACDEEGHLLRELGPDAYDKGLADTGVAFLARVQVTPGTLANLSQVDVEVSAPVAAPAAARSRYAFLTRVGRRS